MAIDPPPPIALEIPVGAKDVLDVTLKGHAELEAGAGSRTGAGDSAVIETDPPGSPRSGRFRESLRLPEAPAGRSGKSIIIINWPGVCVQSIIRPRYHVPAGGICVAREQVRPVPGLDFPACCAHIQDGRRRGYA